MSKTRSLLRAPRSHSARLQLYRTPMRDTHDGSTGTMDPLQCVFREGSMRTPCTLRTRRLRAPTTIRAFRTSSLDRGANVLS